MYITVCIQYDFVHIYYTVHKVHCLRGIYVLKRYKRYKYVRKMAEYLASIFGTEKDKVNCSFYFKIGACRHGDRCSRLHNKPTFSQTILLQNMYQNPNNPARNPDGRKVLTDQEEQAHFDEFFEDVFIELEDKYGEIEEMNVCDNLGDHLIGNVYIKFNGEDNAEKAVMEP